MKRVKLNTNGTPNASGSPIPNNMGTKASFAIVLNLFVFALHRQYTKPARTQAPAP